MYHNCIFSHYRPWFYKLHDSDLKARAATKNGLCVFFLLDAFELFFPYLFRTWMFDLAFAKPSDILASSFLCPHIGDVKSPFLYLSNIYGVLAGEHSKLVWPCYFNRGRGDMGHAGHCSQFWKAIQWWQEETRHRGWSWVVVEDLLKRSKMFHTRSCLEPRRREHVDITMPMYVKFQIRSIRRV